MKATILNYRVVSILMLMLMFGVLRVQAGPAGETNSQAATDTGSGMRDTLAKINAAGAYDVPDLPLRTDEIYAYTSKEFEPYRRMKPFMHHFLLQLKYTGPGRAIPEPQEVETVKIGFIGPIKPTVSVATGGRSHGERLGKKMLQGAQLAIEEANARGGYLKRGIPFELAIHNDNGLWGSSGNEIIKMVYDDKVWAILGTIDGANSHIAIRVALKAEIAIMNSGDTDPTFVETNIPWAFRCISDDRQQSYLLLDYIFRKLELTRIGVIRSSNRYGRFGVREIRDGSRRMGNPILIEMPYEFGETDFSLHLQRMKQAGVEAVVHWGDAVDGARILNQMRATGMTQSYFCCDRCVSEEFVQIAGRNAEGVVCAYPWDPTREDPKYDAFREAYRKRFDEAPETYAAHGYDGMSMLLDAVQKAGLNRAKIRDVLAYRTAPWKGVTGDIAMSACMDDLGEVFLARREGDAWKYYSREDLGVPRGPLRPRESAASSVANVREPE